MAESNDQPSAEEVKVFLDYDNQADPKPVYDCSLATLRSGFDALLPASCAKSA